MPEVQEVFRMATQKVRPEPGALERQFQGQRRRSTRRKAGAVGLAGTLALLVGVVAVLATRGTEPNPAQPASEGHTTPDGVIDVVGRPSGIAEAGGSIWVSTYEGLVYRIDPSTNAITDRIDLGIHACGDLVEDGGSVYVSACGFYPPVRTVRLDAATGEVLGEFPDDLISPVFGGGRAWGFNAGAPELADGVEVDPATGEVVGQLPSPPLGYAFDSLWLQDASAPAIVRIEPDTGAVIASYDLPPGTSANADHGKIGGFVAAGGYAWVVIYGPEPTKAGLYRLDPEGTEIERILSISLDPEMLNTRPGYTHFPGPGSEAFLDAHGDTVWVAESPATVIGIDATTGQIIGTYAAAGRGAANVAATADSIWIANYGDGTVWRYDLGSAS